MISLTWNGQKITLSRSVKLCFGLLILGAAILGCLAAIFDWSPVLIVAGIWLVTLVLVGIVNIYYWVLLRELRPLRRLFMRLEIGGADAIIEEYRVKYEIGDRSVETMLALSSSNAYLGHGQEAELYAYELMTILEERGDCSEKGLLVQRRCDLARIALIDAWEAQGRFSEAAHYLCSRGSLAVNANLDTAIAAWQFFQAGETDNTRAALDEIKPAILGFSSQPGFIPSKYLFMLAYLRYKVFNTDPRADLQRHYAQLAKWEDEAQRNATNPYGARLHEILRGYTRLTGN